MDRAMDSALEAARRAQFEAVHAAAWSLSDGQRTPPIKGRGMLRRLLKSRLPGIDFDRRKQGFWHHSVTGFEASASVGKIFLWSPLLA